MSRTAPHIRADRFDLALSILASLAAAAAAWALVADVSLFVAADDGAPRERLARLARLDSDVRRRPDGVPVWSAADADGDLFARDQVFTGQGAQATLAFDDETVIELGENTLVAIERLPQDGGGVRTVLDVVRGSLSARLPDAAAATTAIKVAGGATLSARTAARVGISVDAEKGARVSVLGGKASLHARKGEGAGGNGDSQGAGGAPGELVLSDGEGAGLASGGALERVAPLAAVLEAPAPGERLTLAEGEPVAFRWRAAGGGSGRGGSGGTLEVARDPEFRSVVATRAAAASGDASLDGLDDGVYYWRVRGSEAGDAAFADERRFSVRRAAPPAATWPPDGGTLRAYEGLGAASVTLGWRARGADAEARFAVEVATDAAFARIVAARSVRDTTLALADLPPGDYVWRVRREAADAPRLAAAWSLPARFKVVSVPPPEAPSALHADVAQGRVALGWQEPLGVAGYEVEVAREPSFDAAAIAWRGSVRAAAAEWQPEADGVYHWRVTARDALGRASRPSAVERLEVRLDAAPAAEMKVPAPKLEAPRIERRYELRRPAVTPAPKKDGAFLDLLRRFLGSGVAYAQDAAAAGDASSWSELSWPAVAGARAYRVQLARDRAFAQLVVEREVAKPGIDLGEIAAGVYWLRIAAVDAEGQPGEWSEAAEVEVAAPVVAPAPVPAPAAVAAPVKLLPAPRLVEPAADAEVEVSTVMPVATLRWDAVKGAVAYRVQVAETADFKRPTYERRTRGQDAGATVAAGTWHWRVQAIGAGEVAGEWGEVRRFEARAVVPGGSASTSTSTSTSTATSTATVEPTPRTSTPAATITPTPTAPLVGRERRWRAEVGYAPAAYRYRIAGEGPDAGIDAMLFNSFYAGGELALSRRWGLGLFARRTATTLFSDGAAGGAVATQTPVKIAPTSVAANAAVTAGQDALYATARAGVALATLVRFSRAAGGEVAAREEQAAGPTLGLGAGAALAPRWAVRASADLLLARSSGLRGLRHLQARLAAERALGDDRATFVAFGYLLDAARYEASEAAGRSRLEQRLQAPAVSLGFTW